MKNELVLDLAVLEEFQKQARARRKNPGNLLTKLMREQLEIWEDEKLFEEMRRDAQKSGYKARDAVKLVRQHRRDKKALQAIADQAVAEGKPVPTDLLERLLTTPIKLDRFTPLTREELYDRQGETR
jgi:hypothetical protein